MTYITCTQVVNRKRTRRLSTSRRRTTAYSRRLSCAHVLPSSTRLYNAAQAPDGTKNVAVGQTIAVFAEDGDDIASLDIPKDDPTPAPAPSPGQSTPSPPASEQQKQASSSKQASHEPVHSTKPLFPSVLRLLQEHGVAPDGIKGTGVRGMLTKGDVLAHLKLASSPTGTYKEPPSEMRKPAGAPAKTPAPQKVLQTFLPRETRADGARRCSTARLFVSSSSRAWRRLARRPRHCPSRRVRRFMPGFPSF